MFPFIPSTIYSDNSTVELKATLGGVNTSYGMPIFHFENYEGKLVATTTATYVNGIDVRINSSCLAGQPVGTYIVKVYNAPGQNTSPNKSLGFSTISIMDPPPPICYPQPGGIDQDTCEQVYGRTWDPMTCRCFF